MERFEKIAQIVIPMAVGALVVFFASPFVEGLLQLMVIAAGIMIGLVGIAKHAESNNRGVEPEPWRAQATDKARSSFALFRKLFEENAGRASVRLRREGLPVLDDGAWSEVTAVLPSGEIVVANGIPKSEADQTVPFGEIVDWRVVLPDGSVRGAFSRYAELEHQRLHEGGILPRELLQERALLVDCHRPIGHGIVACDRPKEWEQVIAHWKAFGQAVEEAGGEVSSFSVAAPAQESELADAEAALGVKLPPGLRRVLAEFSAGVDYFWLLPDHYTDESGNRVAAESGMMRWSLHDIVRFQQNNAEWFSESCPNMLAVCEVPNGDIIAIDYGVAGKEPVRYWSHDGWEHSDFEIAPDFASYLIETSKIGAVGPEYCYWMPFVDESISRLDADGAAAQAFRHALRVRLDQRD